MMTIRCVALFSGGLDSLLAVRIMQQLGVEVVGVHFKTLFTSCQVPAEDAARRLGLRLTILTAADDYLELVKYPRFGYGEGVSPCVDCRIYMFQRARQFMVQNQAQFLVSGEVLNQRLKSQQRRDLEVISFHADVEDLLLRPLSARRLPITLPERAGWVDRKQLFGISGRGRRPLIALGRQLGLEEIPPRSNGCLLTEAPFSQKVRDLFQFAPQAFTWDFELLRIGRHVRLNNGTKVVLGRHQTENEQLHELYRRPDSRASAMLHPENFPGPRLLLIGPFTSVTVASSTELMMRYSKHVEPQSARIVCEAAGESRVLCRETPGERRP